MACASDDAAEVEYTIDRILKEKKVHGGMEYLVSSMSASAFKISIACCAAATILEPAGRRPR